MYEDDNIPRMIVISSKMKMSLINGITKQNIFSRLNKSSLNNTLILSSILGGEGGCVKYIKKTIKTVYLEK